MGRVRLGILVLFLGNMKGQMGKIRGTHTIEVNFDLIILPIGSELEKQVK